MTEHNRYVNGRIVTPDKVLDSGEFEIYKGRFSYVGPKRSGGDLKKAVNLRGAWVVPGFIDFQVNDAVLFQFPSNADEARRDRLDIILNTQLDHGVTAMYLATVAQPVPHVLQLLRSIAAYMDAQDASPDRTRLLGAFVEGTFMNPECSGAHNPDNILRPSIPVLRRLLKTGALRQLNVAPEWGSAAMRVIRAAAEQGILVGAGHTKCTADELQEAVSNGLRYLIHLTNGPTGTLTKSFHDGGTLEGALTDDRMSVSLIADGYHVDPRYIRDIIERKGYGRVVVISDLMFGDCRPVSPLDLNGVDIRVAGGGAYAYVAGKRTEDGYTRYPRKGAVTLAGNACWAMDVMFSNILHYLTHGMTGVWNRSHPALPVDEAMRQAAMMTATNPACLGGVDTGKNRTGQIAKGFLADFTVGRLQRRRQQSEYSIQRVFRQGAQVR